MVLLNNFLFAIKLGDVGAWDELDTVMSFNERTEQGRNQDQIGSRIYFGMIRSSESENIACILDQCILATGAGPKKRNVVSTCEGDSVQGSVCAGVRATRDTPDALVTIKLRGSTCQLGRIGWKPCKIEFAIKLAGCK